MAGMPMAEKEARLEEAFERIEETILPCIAMMLDTLLDASQSVAEKNADSRSANSNPRRRARGTDPSRRTVEPGRMWSRANIRPRRGLSLVTDDFGMERRIDIPTRQYHDGVLKRSELAR